MTNEANALRGLKLRPLHVAGRQTAHEFVRETLRHAILSGDLPAGTRLVQAELADALDVSTTPVREALRDVAASGLIRFDPHRGGVVNEITAMEVEEVYDIRTVLEAHAMRLAAPNLDAATLARARSIHEKMLAGPGATDWVMLNRDFHLTIYEAADSPRLLEILLELLDTSTMYVSAALRINPGLMDHANHEHAEILARLEAGDAEGAVATIEQHMKISRSVLNPEG